MFPISYNQCTPHCLTWIPKSFDETSSLMLADCPRRTLTCDIIASQSYLLCPSRRSLCHFLPRFYWSVCSHWPEGRRTVGFRKLSGFYCWLPLAARLCDERRLCIYHAAILEARRKILPTTVLFWSETAKKTYIRFFLYFRMKVGHTRTPKPTPFRDNKWKRTLAVQKKKRELRDRPGLK